MLAESYWVSPLVVETVPAFHTLEELYDRHKEHILDVQRQAGKEDRILSLLVGMIIFFITEKLWYKIEINVVR